MWTEEGIEEGGSLRFLMGSEFRRGIISERNIEKGVGAE
jgi:hypothetical protein